jgi:hypothetical protein
MRIQTTSASQDVTATGGSGAICQRSGPYKCNSHEDVVVVFQRGDRFTSCPMNNGHATTWSVVREPPADR